MMATGETAVEMLQTLQRIEELQHYVVAGNVAVLVCAACIFGAILAWGLSWWKW